MEKDLPLNGIPTNRHQKLLKGLKLEFLIHAFYEYPCQTASTNCHRNQDTLNQIHVPTNTADRSVSPPSDAKTMHTHLFLVSICLPSHQLDEYDTRTFFGGSGAGPWPGHAWHYQKCLEPYRHSSKKKRLQGGLEPGGRPPEARGCQSRQASIDCQPNQNTPNHIHVRTNTANRGLSQSSDIQRLCMSILLSSDLCLTHLCIDHFWSYDPSSTIHFNWCVCWLEIHVQTTIQHRHILQHITFHTLIITFHLLRNGFSYQQMQMFGR